MSIEDRLTDPVEVGVAYVARVLDPFRVTTGEDGKLQFDGGDVQTIDRLVDLFAPDIKEQQIRPDLFISAVVGSAAMIGVQLVDPQQSPRRFNTFIRQANWHLNAYYDSMAEIEETT